MGGGFGVKPVLDTSQWLKVALVPIHEAQLLTCLKLSNKRIGFLMNFHAYSGYRMTAGIKRNVL